MVNLVKKREGLTLIEILVAVSLLAIVITAVGGVDSAGRRTLISGNRRARVQDEARLAMEHMVRNIRLGNEVQLSVGPADIQVWMDWNPRTRQPINTPDDDRDDSRVQYRYNPVQDEIQYRDWRPPPPGPPWSPWGPIAEEVVDPAALGRPIFTITANPSADPIFLTIDLTARSDASSPADPPNNPEVRLQGGVSLRSRARD